MELYHYHIHTYTVEPCLAAIQYNKYSIFYALKFYTNTRPLYDHLS